MQNVHNAHIIMMHGQMIVGYYIVLRTSCPNRATTQKLLRLVHFSHEKMAFCHTLRNKNNRKTVELMEKPLCKSVLFRGFGNSVSSECKCRFIFQSVDCCFFSLPFSVSFSSFSRWLVVYIQKSNRKSTIAHEKFKRMENVQFIVANLKTFDDNDSAVNAIFAISNVQMINLTFRRRQKKETNAWRSTEFHKSCRIIIFYSFILKTNIACLHSLFLE